MDNNLYSVGKLFDKNKTSYSEEGGRIDLTDDGINIILYFHGPHQEEIKSVMEGNINIGFIKLDSVIFFSLKIGSIPYQTLPYSIHLSGNLSSIEYPNEGEGLPATIFLVDSNNGILKAIRFVGLGNSFSNEFLNAAEKQSHEAFDSVTYNNDVKSNFAKYDDPSFMKLCRYTYKLRKD